MIAAQDTDGRVRCEAITAASWLDPAQGLPIVAMAAAQPVDAWIKPTLDAALAYLSGRTPGSASTHKPEATTLTGAAKDLFDKGAAVYRRDGHCVTCHQADGKGLPAAQFPPLAGSDWVQGSPARLIRLTLHGLMGPMEVNGQPFAGVVPMTPFKFLDDQEVAAVLTYVRNAFGNQAAPIAPEQVATERAATEGQRSFYQPAELLKLFPMR